jgi:hypothetical protein
MLSTKKVYILCQKIIILGQRSIKVWTKRIGKNKKSMSHKKINDFWSDYKTKNQQWIYKGLTETGIRIKKSLKECQTINST